MRHRSVYWCAANGEHLLIYLFMLAVVVGGVWHVPGLWCERARTRVERYEELPVCHDGLG
jgi:hypothetical protein